MKPQTVKLPAFLASVLVNGDTSGLTCTCGELANAEIERREPGEHASEKQVRGYCDFRALADAIAYCQPGRIVSCEGESYFARCNDLPGPQGFVAGEVLDYVVLYPEG